MSPKRAKWPRTAVAFDYDGTIARSGILNPGVRQALGRLRALGVASILVTGRTLEDMREVEREIEDLFDRLVLENGALLVVPHGEARPLAPPVSRELARVLEERGIWTYVGRVLVATDMRYEEDVIRESERLGLRVRLERNRNALMVLPEGVDKALGLAQAVADLGLDLENTTAFGDAENDCPMLAAAGLGIAVGDAIHSAREAADRVLAKPNGDGVAAYLESLVESLERQSRR